MTNNASEVKRCVVVVPGVSEDLGTSLLMTGLESRLAEVVSAGYSVTLIYTHSAFIAESRYFISGLQVPVLPLEQARPGPSLGPLSPGMYQCRCVYEQLRSTIPADLIIASNRDGLLFYVQNARRQGLAFQTTTIEIIAEEPLACIHQAEGFFCSDSVSAVNMWLERHTVEMAGRLNIRTHHLRNWMIDAGYNLPGNTTVSGKVKFDDVVVRSEPIDQRVDEIVFVGGLTRRNGLSHFIKALNGLSVASGFSVTFAGAAPADASLKSELDQFLSQTSLPCKCVEQMSTAAMLAYLKTGNKLAVLLPVNDLAPWIAELLISKGINLLIPAHHSIRSMDQALQFSGIVLETVSPVCIADTISTLIETGRIVRADTAADNGQATKAADAVMAQPVTKDLPAEFQQSERTLTADKISVCIAHYCRPQMLDMALASLARQSLCGFEVIVVDDGSPAEYQPDLQSTIHKYQHKLQVKLILKENAYLGASRNTAWRRAVGDYILFMDDDNIAAPNEIEMFAKAAANSGDDVLTCFSDTFDESVDLDLDPSVKNRITPMGPCLSVGAIYNCFGDSNSFWRKAVLEQLNGFTELKGVGKEDNEIFARAVFAGFKLSVVPERLFYYRLSKNRMRHHHLNPESGTHHVISTYRKSLVPEIKEMAELLVGQDKKIRLLESRLKKTEEVFLRTNRRAQLIGSLLAMAEPEKNNK